MGRLIVCVAGELFNKKDGNFTGKSPQLRVTSVKVPDWYTARRVGEAVYGYKTLVQKNTGRVPGAHLVGPHADETINLFGFAMRHNLTADDLKTTMITYPTGASDIGAML